MYNDFLNIINAGGYDLATILHKIDVIYTSGGLDDDQRTELQELARSKANYNDSLGGVDSRLDALEAWRREVDAKLDELEWGAGGEPGTDPEPPQEDEWPEYVAPTGAHDAYYNGDKMTWNGGHYICIAPIGTACVWDPATYPTYWQKVEEQETEEPGAEG